MHQCGEAAAVRFVMPAFHLWMRLFEGDADAEIGYRNVSDSLKDLGGINDLSKQLVREQ